MKTRNETEFDQLFDSDVILIAGETHDDDHTDEVTEIIQAVPSWILRWGISIIFLLIVVCILISSFVSYPEVVSTSMKINSRNAPKSVLSRANGKLGKILVKEGQKVKTGKLLGYLETSGSQEDIFSLKDDLTRLKTQLISKQSPRLSLHESLNLGDLQNSFQSLYNQFLEYSGTLEDGYLKQRLAFLQRELNDVKLIKNQIISQQKIQEKESQNAETEYRAYQTLYKNKVISRSEFASQENKYLASKYPGENSKTALITNTGNLTAKQKEVLEINHLIEQQNTKMIQAVNQCLADINTWMMKNTFVSPVDGKVNFAGIIQQDQNVNVNQEVFIINPGNADFFGEIHIPQYNMGKIYVGEKVIVKLQGYPYQQFGFLRGKLASVSEVPFRDSVFIGSVFIEKYENKNPDKKIVLKNGMLATADIITRESNLLERFYQTLKGVLSN